MTTGGDAPGTAPGMLAGDLGGTHLRLAVFDADGTIVRHERYDTPVDDPAALIRFAQALLADSPVPVDAFVIGVPGPLSYAEGRAFHLPHLPRWEGFVDAATLAGALGLPALVANDADLAALGEHRFGAGRGTRDMLYVTSSTSVGGGVILNGLLLHGRRSLAEIGWTTIDWRAGTALEALASGSAVERLSGLDGAEATRRALAGDAAALAVFAEVGAALAVGIVNAVFCFMPERVVIGGGASLAGDLLLAPVRERVAREGPRLAIEPDVVVASAGDDVGLRGAFALWQDVAAGHMRELRFARPGDTPPPHAVWTAGA